MMEVKNRMKKKMNKKKEKKARMMTRFQCNNSQQPEYFERREIYNCKIKRQNKETLIKSNCRRKN